MLLEHTKMTKNIIFIINTKAAFVKDSLVWRDCD